MATTLNNLAALLIAQGKYAEPEPLLRRALEIDKAALGPEHPYVAIVAENLARSLRRLGREEEARELEERVAKIRGGGGA